MQTRQSSFLVKSTLKSDHQFGKFKRARVPCRTCPFISNANKISGPKRTVAITDHFSCISTNLIYCVICTLCKKICIGETGRRLGDRFREHLRDVEIRRFQTSRATFQPPQPFSKTRAGLWPSSRSSLY